MKPQVDHAVFNMRLSQFECRHCGRMMAVQFPMGCREFALLCDAFAKAHKECKAP